VICLSIRTDHLENKVADPETDATEGKLGDESPVFGNVIEEVKKYKEKIVKLNSQIDAAKKENVELKEKTERKEYGKQYDS